MRCNELGKVISLILISILVISSAYCVSIGVGGNVFLKDVLKGGFATSRLYVSNSNPFPITVGAWILGDTADWIKLDPQPNFLVDANSNRFVDVTVQPPPFVANGAYTGGIVFFIADVPAFAGAGSGVAVSAGATSNVIIEISDKQTVSSKVTKVVAERAEECRPVNVKITVNNIGNVEITPNYTLKMYHKEKGFVEQVTMIGDIIKPTIERTDTVSIDSSTEGLGSNWQQFLCIPQGDYYADITVSNHLGNTIYKGKVDIYILEKGALSVSGALTNVTHKPSASLGEPVKITGTFENTGDSTEQAKLKIEVYKEDRLVEVVTGDAALANPGKPTTVVAYFTPKELGTFDLNSVVSFGGKFTEPAFKTSLDVEMGLTIIILIIAIPLAILLIILLIWFRKQRGY